MKVLEIDIPFEILCEEIKWDEEIQTIRINRIYKIPKVSPFESPIKYLNVLREFDKKHWKEDGLEAVLYLTGWKDPKCRSYGITIIIHLFK